MRVARTDRFKKSYQGLSDNNKRRAEKALRLLLDNMSHPGLRAKRIRGIERIWEARVSKSIRMTFEIEGDVIVLRNIGGHDKTLGRP